MQNNSYSGEEGGRNRWKDHDKSPGIQKRKKVFYFALFDK